MQRSTVVLEVYERTDRSPGRVRYRAPCSVDNVPVPCMGFQDFDLTIAHKRKSFSSAEQVGILWMGGVESILRGYYAYIAQIHPEIFTYTNLESLSSHLLCPLHQQSFYWQKLVDITITRTSSDVSVLWQCVTCENSDPNQSNTY